jgi:hypothetical protein
MGVAKDTMRCAFHCPGFYNMQPVHANRRFRLRRRFNLPARQVSKNIEGGSRKWNGWDFPTGARVLDQMFVNLRSRGNALKISEQAPETWTRARPEYGTDKSASHRSARNPNPPGRIGLPAAAIEIHSGSVVESVLAKHGQADSTGWNGRNGGPKVLAQFSTPFHNPANWQRHGRTFAISFQQNALAIEPGDDFQRLLPAFAWKLLQQGVPFNRALEASQPLWQPLIESR